MPKAIRVRQPLYGRMLVKDPLHPSPSSNATKSPSISRSQSTLTFRPPSFSQKAKSKQTLSISSLTRSLTTALKSSPLAICHLEINIPLTDLLPLSSPSLIDRTRLYHTILPFSNVRTVTLVMGFKRSTDVEEICLSQDLEDMRNGLDEFLQVVRENGRCEGEEERKNKGKGRITTPIFRVRWLYPVEETDDEWLDYYMYHYGLDKESYARYN